MKIRLYEDKDYKDVQNICIGGSENFNRNILLNMYCNYYIEQEKENVYVLADEKDTAVGYIFCAENWEIYKEIYKKYYMEELKSLSLDEYNEKLSENDYIEDVMKEFPAHLHIDINKEYRSGGYGSKLVACLVDKLKESKVAGVMLTVGEDNVRAHKFYEKNNFVLLKENENVKVYGLKINE